ncbi:MAG: hypothetical protein ACYTBP_12515, partial [Planctomycetota bacterium]
MRSIRFITTSIAVLFCIFTVPVFGNMVDTISGRRTATLIDDGGQYDGWYLYEIEVTWNLSHGLSHWNVILKLECLADDHRIEFDSAA